MNCMNDSSFAEPARSIAVKEAEAKQKKIKEALSRYFVQNMDPSCWGNAWADDGYGGQKYSLSFICNDDVTKEEADKLAGLIIMALKDDNPQAAVDSEGGCFGTQIEIRIDCCYKPTHEQMLETDAHKVWDAMRETGGKKLIDCMVYEFIDDDTLCYSVISVPKLGLDKVKVSYDDLFSMADNAVKLLNARLGHETYVATHRIDADKAVALTFAKLV